MKKTTLQLNGVQGAEEANKVGEALNNLSGVVAADIVIENQKAYAYSGDRLLKNVLTEAIGKTGYTAAVVQEEYLSDVSQFKNSLK